jgi:hypothetical protein
MDLDFLPTEKSSGTLGQKRPPIPIDAGGRIDLSFLDFEVDPIIANYGFKTAPYYHQVQALQKSFRRREFALLAEMGTGKSKILIDNAAILYELGAIKTLMIVAPNTVYLNWLKQEIPAHLPNRIFDRVVWYIHKKSGTLHKLLPMIEDTGRLNILLFNVELFSTRADKAKLLGKFMDMSPTFLVIDESTIIKSPDSNRTAMLISVGRHAKVRRIATGMVAPNGPMDLFSQYEFLKAGLLGCENPFIFKARYCQVQSIAVGMRIIEKVVGVQNVERLREQMAPHSYRILKRGCLDLPDKIFMPQYIELDEISRKHYTKMKEEALFLLDHENPEDSLFVRAKNRMSVVSKLRMIINGHMKLQLIRDGAESERFSLTRIDQTIELASSIDGPVLIWADFICDLEDIYKAAGEKFGADYVGIIYGGASGKNRERDFKKFQEGKLKVFVLNPASARFGRTLIQSHHHIYYSNSSNLEYRAQSEDRTDRLGQTEPSVYMDLIAVNTYDITVQGALKKKMDVANAINNEGSYRKMIEGAEL